MGLILIEGKNPYVHLLAGECATLQKADVGGDRMNIWISILPLLSVNGLLDGGLAGRGQGNFLSLGW